MLHGFLDRWSEAGVWVKISWFFGVWLGLWLPIAIPLARRWNWYPGKSLTPQKKLTLVGSLYFLFPVTISGAAAIENLSFSDYGWTWQLDSLKSLAIGVGLGVFGIAILAAVQRIFGWIRWEFKVPSIDALPTVMSPLSVAGILALWVAGTEEFLFRGFVQTQFQSQLSLGAAAAITSAIFAVLHLVWGWRETLPEIPGLWLMGLILTLARVVDDGNLSLAWGLHTGWVWAAIFLESTGAIVPIETAPAWLSGIDGRPLAGVLGLGLLMATGGFLQLIIDT
ncbi:lysostaphin resistance A-like protein [Baaleninema sp.]|uniref:CPBP family intramembrane glutamic endopeptidase n=1 Tax=Baaleninema sp. TaxID=3101197 RepID=UPI003D004159